MRYQPESLGLPGKNHGTEKSDNQGSLGFPVAIKLLKYGKKLFFPFLPIVQISDSDPHHVNMLERQTYSTSSSSHIL